MRPPIPENNEARLEALASYGILDTPVEADFDEFTALAARVCGTPVSVITFIDRDRQWFKSEVGQKEGETPLETSFCAHAILEDGDFCLVPDARRDPRFLDNPLVMSDPGLRFYAGAILRDAQGFALGTLCVADMKPRMLQDFQRQALRLMAKNIVQMLEIRRQAEQFRQISRKLNAELNLRKEILGIVSHDLRAPLAAIQLVNHVAAREVGRDRTPPKELLEDLVEVLEDTMGDMHRLIGDLSDYSMSECGTLPMQFADCRPGAVVEGVQRRFKLASEHLGVSLVVEDATNGASGLKADAQRLSQALGNLVGNALNYTAKGGKITLTARIHPDAVEFHVQDTGCGIQPDNLGRIFDPHWTSGEFEGSRGLGLEITRGIVYSHKGTLAVESKPGEGSTFTILLPIATEEAA
ncbi:GAF domain-containing sensor histidine kinase [Luteolibacter sp. LG18]|uniref:sensor histidine kinase n=1 Tax=Luteolibacter sp. LG18 TaxID=2819286 RepID=UPI002B2A4F21|nr:sensor histidine kinase [Luteolibacter sp. LG18]